MITPEEAIRPLKELSARKKMADQCDQASASDIRLYHALDTAIEALEKQIPKKPITEENGVRRCPHCGDRLTFADIVLGFKHCNKCGQAIDWNNTNSETQKHCLTEDCPYQKGDPCEAAETCGGYEGAE